MTRAVEILESIREINETFISDIVDIAKTEKKTEDGKTVATLKVKGIMGTQDARRLMAHIAGMGYEAKMTTDNLGVEVTIPKGGEAIAKEELGI